MSKRTLGLILILVLVTGVLFSVALFPQKPVSPTQNSIALPSVSPAQTNLFLSPNPLIISSPSASVDLNIDTKENKVTAVQLELSYDPQAIIITDITPSNFFTNPVVLLLIPLPNFHFYAVFHSISENAHHQ